MQMAMLRHIKHTIALRHIKHTKDTTFATNCPDDAAEFIQLKKFIDGFESTITIEQARKLVECAAYVSNAKLMKNAHGPLPDAVAPPPAANVAAPPAAAAAAAIPGLAAYELDAQIFRTFSTDQVRMFCEELQCYGTGHVLAAAGVTARDLLDAGDHLLV
jgi:hypothetical protein